jgi:hypothetical protein
MALADPADIFAPRALDHANTSAPASVNFIGSFQPASSLVRVGFASKRNSALAPWYPAAGRLFSHPLITALPDESTVLTTHSVRAWRDRKSDQVEVGRMQLGFGDAVQGDGVMTIQGDNRIPICIVMSCIQNRLEVRK